MKFEMPVLASTYTWKPENEDQAVTSTLFYFCEWYSNKIETENVIEMTFYCDHCWLLLFFSQPVVTELSLFDLMLYSRIDKTYSTNHHENWGFCDLFLNPGWSNRQPQKENRPQPVTGRPNVRVWTTFDVLFVV